MIGNDLVDLQLAKIQSNWQRKGFLEKQFTDFEQSQIFASSNPFLQVWLFWSMKEAAYKCFVQQYPKRFFAPKMFACKMMSQKKGMVRIDENIYFSDSIITDKYVHTIVQKNKISNYISDLFLIDQKENQKQSLNQKILARFIDANSVKKNEIGIPFLYQHDKKLPFSVSFSHHGKYGAYAVLN